MAWYWWVLIIVLVLILLYLLIKIISKMSNGASFFDALGEAVSDGADVFDGDWGGGGDFGGDFGGGD